MNLHPMTIMTIIEIDVFLFQIEIGMVDKWVYEGQRVVLVRMLVVVVHDMPVVVDLVDPLAQEHDSEEDENSCPILNQYSVSFCHF